MKRMPRVLENPVTFMKDLNNQGVLPERISAEPVPVAVAVSEKLLDPGSGKENLKPRMIVFGDTECISNADIIRNQVSFGWVASGLEWMAEKKGLIGPRPKETSSYAINPQKVNVQRTGLSARLANDAWHHGPGSGHLGCAAKNR